MEESEEDADAIQIDTWEEDTEDDMSLDNEIEELIRHCEELHVHHHTAIETLQSLHERLTSGTGLTIQVLQEPMEPMEPVDLGDHLEKLHQQTMADIQEGKSTSFYNLLLHTFEHAIIE